jgi:hypothetical protein
MSGYSLDGSSVRLPDSGRPQDLRPVVDGLTQVRTRERMVRRDVGGASNQQGATVRVVKTLKGSVTP